MSFVSSLTVVLVLCLWVAITLAFYAVFTKHVANFLVFDSEPSSSESDALQELRRQLRDEDGIYGLTTPELRQKTVILSEPRSGSSFLAGFVAQFPGTFFHFEPLKAFHGDAAIDAFDANNLIESLFTCDYKASIVKKFIGYFYRHAQLGFFDRNARVFQKCSSVDWALCYEADFNERACEMHPTGLVKIIRHEKIDLEKLIEDDEMIKVVVIIRDPRAIRLSHIRTFCHESGLCEDTNRFCLRYESFIKTISKVKTNYPDRTLIVKYEDFMERPWEESRTLLSHLNLKWTGRARRYLKSHMSHRDKLNDPYSTFRLSERQAFAWKNDHSDSAQEIVNEVEENSHCQEVILEHFDD